MASERGDEIGTEAVRRAQQGDPRAIDGLVRALLPYLGRVCGAIALERGDDALQETMIAVMSHIGALREPAALRGWARRIAVRESIRVARTGWVQPVDNEQLEAVVHQGDPETAIDIRDALTSLSPDQRAVLVLQHIEGLSEQEIAEVLGVAVGTVKSRLSRAREAFRTGWTS
jgi:RNA polymerase sigma factor (sigma-70 family)